MSVNFNWEYFWSYYQRIDCEAVKKKMKEEVLADNWLFEQPIGVQIMVLTYAPKEFVEEVKPELSPDAIKALSPNLIDWKNL